MQQQNLNLNCVIHPKEQIKSICLNKRCKGQKLMCVECLMIDETHNFHKKELINIASFTQWVTEKTSKYQSLTNFLNSMAKTINDKVEQLRKQTNKMFQIKIQSLSLFNSTELTNLIIQLNGVEDFNKSVQNRLPPCFDTFIKQIDFLLNRLQLDPNNFYDLTEQEKQKCQLLNDQGNELMKNKEHEKASKIFDEILMIDAKHINSLSQKGQLLYQLKQYEKSIQYYDQILEIDPKNSDILFWKACAQQKLHLFEQAYQNINQAISIEPMNVIYQSQKGFILSDMKLFDEAIDSFDQALKIGPNCEAAQSAKKNILEIQVQMGQKKKQ